MANQLWIVRVVMGNPDSDRDLFLECLRRAGLINLHRLYTEDHPCVFDLFPPKAQWNDSKHWASTTANQMSSFGFNAVAAPATVPV